MTSAVPGQRNNLFVIAALALPVLVVFFFLLANFVPRLMVAPPAHDLVVRVSRPWEASLPRVSVDYAVRDGRIEGVVRPVPEPNGYPQLWTLFLLDHQTFSARELPVSLPASVPAGETVTVRVDALEGRTISARSLAPDGYELRTRTSRSPGIVGEIFGGSRADAIGLSKGSRVVSFTLPAPYEYQSSSVSPVGWVVNTDAH
jgi:hypothetical protein